MPNRSTDRRIGLNVQFLAPHVRQLKCDDDSALLVRGEGRFHHFKTDAPAKIDLGPAVIKVQKQLNAKYLCLAGQE